MTITCPACKKANTPSESNELGCIRCSCGLSVLLKIYRTADASQQKACHHLIQGDYPSSLDHAQRSWNLKHSKTTAILLFINHCALRQTQEALKWRRTIRQNFPA